jgi:tRNA(Arg) A34 adenosine deaminase TadA
MHIVATVYNKKGHIIAQARNSYTKTHPKQAKFAALAGNPKAIYLHSEIAALVKCREKPHRISVVRYLKDGTTGNAEPCAICKLAIKEAGIKLVEYSI